MTEVPTSHLPLRIEDITAEWLTSILTERFPDGTALQFVYEADRVGVFLDSE